MALADFSPFAGKVFIRWDPATHHEAALLFGAAASAPASSTLAAPFRRALVFFSDGSAGFRTSDPSGKRRWTSASAVYRLDAEGEWAQRGWPSTRIRPGKKLPKKLDPTLLHEVCELSQRLAGLGVLVELHWVPGHKRVLGNEMADRAATAHRPDSIDPGRFPSAKPEELRWERDLGQVVGRAEKRRREEGEELVEGEGEGKKRKVEVE